MTVRGYVGRLLRENLWAFAVLTLGYGIAGVAIYAYNPIGWWPKVAYWMGLIWIVAGIILLYASTRNPDEPSDDEGEEEEVVG